MSKVTIPADGEKITLNADGSINVPAKPIITYIEGDGIGSDITPAMIRVVDAAVEKAYGGEEDFLDGGLCRREGHQSL